MANLNPRILLKANMERDVNYTEGLWDGDMPLTKYSYQLLHCGEGETTGAGYGMGINPFGWAIVHEAENFDFGGGPRGDGTG